MGPTPMDEPRVSVIIPAYNESARIGATVAAARTIAGVQETIVVDDGSSDGTAEEAARAGARVIAAPHRGKGGALARGIAAASGNLILLLDADLQSSAGNAAVLLDPVRAEEADLAVAVLPSPRTRGGFGIALAAARLGLWLLTGRRFAAPLSGQRCMTAALARTLPWTRGFGVEVAATADATAIGARIVEVPVELSHASTGRTVSGFVHRGRQFGAVIAALAPRALYPVGPTARPAPARRMIVAAVAWAALLAVARALDLAVFGMEAAVAIAIVAVALSLAVNQRGRFMRPNYLGREVPAMGGLAFAVGPLAAWGLSAAGIIPHTALIGWTAAAVIVMAAAGFADDRYGSRQARGLRGHLGSLARGQITTGAVKALAGAIAGLSVGWVLARPSIALTILNALIIALTTNLVNLLDLRPGRAIKGFLLLAGIAIAANAQTFWLVAPIGIIALAFAPVDLGGRAMMGDTGANALGAAAGIALVSALPLWARVVAAAVLIGVHLYSERHSLSELIMRIPVLRWLDRLGRPDDAW